MKKAARISLGLGILGLFAAGAGFFRPRPTLPAVVAEANALPLVLAKLAEWKLPCADPTNIDAKEVTAVAAAIPAELKVLDGKRVTLNGFAYPFNDDSGKLLGFLLMPTQGLCCYGKVPAAHEVVCVFPGPVKDIQLDEPIQVTGVFSAEVKNTSFADKGGCLMPWRLQCEKVSKLEVPVQTN